MQVDNLAQDGHQGKEVAKNTVTTALKVQSSRTPLVGLCPIVQGVEDIRIGISGVGEIAKVSALPRRVVQWLQEAITFDIQEEERSVVAEGQVPVDNVYQPPD